ncbi:hypothetical protein AB0K48_61280, partial [Nonomuraea sp. NPDC055795]
MARHDREESLEEQLAWLDAIKETEEAPVAVSATAEAAASPYPKDPWLSVPSAQETPTPPLFRAAVDSVYGSAAAEELPATESEAAEWLGDEAAPGKEPAGSVDDEAESFLAPLKPLPRPDDTDSYTLLSPAPAPAEEETPPKAEYTEADTQPDNPWPKPSEWSRPAFDLPKPAFDEPKGGFGKDFDSPFTQDLPLDFERSRAAVDLPEPDAPEIPEDAAEEERLQKRFEAFKPDWSPRNDPFGQPADRPAADRPAPEPLQQPAEPRQPFNEQSFTERSFTERPQPADRGFERPEPARSEPTERP